MMLLCCLTPPPTKKVCETSVRMPPRAVQMSEHTGWEIRCLHCARQFKGQQLTCIFHSGDDNLRKTNGAERLPELFSPVIWDCVP